MTGSAPELSTLAAVVNRQSADLSLYADFLTTSLAGALPPDQLVIERKRGMFGRVSDDAPVLSVKLRLGENTYSLSRLEAGALPTAGIIHEVGGIVLSTRAVDLGEWSTLVAGGLKELSERNEVAAAALARVTGFTV